MLRAAIVPECDRIRLPIKADLEFRPRDVTEQKLEQRVALVFGHCANAARKSFIHIERLAAGDRMRPHYGVLVPWEYRPRIVYSFIRIATSKGAFRVMDRRSFREKRFHLLGQGIIGRIHIGK